MPRFWGFHQCAIHYSELRHWQGRSFPFHTPIDPRMRVGDHVYLFWADDELYGRGIIESIGKPNDKNMLREVSVQIIAASPPGVKVKEEIKSNPLFENYDRIKQEGCLSSFNDDQLRFLNGCLARIGIKPPPDPDTVREEEATAPLRPVITTFVQGEQLRIDETRFDEFKTIVGPDPVKAVLNELDA